MAHPPAVNQSDLVARLAEIERRLALLETAPSLGSSSIKNGLLVILNDTLDPMVELGLLDNGGYGIRVRYPSGATIFSVTDLYGQDNPALQLPLVPEPTLLIDAYGRPTSVSGTWETTHTSTLFAVAGRLRWNLLLDPNVSTMDARIRVTEIGGSNFQTVGSITGVTTQQQWGGSGDLDSSGTATGTDDPIGRYYGLSVEVQRTAGAAPVAIAPIQTMSLIAAV